MVMENIAVNKQYEDENNEKLKLETLIRSVGGNLQTKIHVINLYGLKTAENLQKRSEKLKS